MKPSDVLRQFDLQERIQADFPGMKRESFPDLVRFSRVGPGVNFVLYSHLQPETADITIQAQIDELKAFEGPFEWKTYQHDRPTDLGDRLKNHGFIPDTPAPVLCLDLDELPASLTMPPSADIRRLVDAAELSQVVAIHERVWGGDFSWIPERFSRELRQPGFLEIYLAYVEGKAVSVGWTHFQEWSGFASLWGGSTVPAFRGRGLYTAILAQRVQAAQARGRRYVTVEAEAASHRILVRHGFDELTKTTTFAWEPEAS